MDGNEVRQRFICLMDVARNCIIKLLTYFISQWPLDNANSPLGHRVHNFLSNHNKDKRIYDELNKHVNLKKEAVLYGDGLRFQSPVKIEELDITSLCIILELDVDQFQTRPAKHRRNGVSQLICHRNGHLYGCCPSCCGGGGKCTPTKCNHHESFGEKKCRKTKCGRSLKQCIEGSAPCCAKCNSCNRCKQAHGLPQCPNQKLREIIKNIRTFRNLVAHKTIDAFDKLRTGNFVDDRFPNCPDFESLSATCESYVKDLLDYLLNTASFVTQNDYDDAVTEISVTRRPDSLKLIERLYSHALARDKITLKNFELQFEMREISSWMSTFWRFLGSGQTFTERDIDIKSKLSLSIKEFVRSYFKKHDIDNESLNLVRVNKTGRNAWPTYTFVLKPTSTEAQEFMTEYQDCNSKQSDELWEDLQDHIREKVSDELGVDVEFSLFQWSVGSLIITTAIRKENGEWREHELQSLNELITGLHDRQFTESVIIDSITNVATRNEDGVSYTFTIACSSSAVDGVNNVVKDLPNISSDEMDMIVLDGVMESSEPGSMRDLDSHEQKVPSHVCCDESDGVKVLVHDPHDTKQQLFEDKVSYDDIKINITLGGGASIKTYEEWISNCLDEYKNFAQKNKILSDTGMILLKDVLWKNDFAALLKKEFNDALFVTDSYDIMTHFSALGFSPSDLSDTPYKNYASVFKVCEHIMIYLPHARVLVVLLVKNLDKSKNWCLQLDKGLQSLLPAAKRYIELHHKYLTEGELTLVTSLIVPTMTSAEAQNQKVSRISPCKTCIEKYILFKDHLTNPEMFKRWWDEVSKKLKERQKDDEGLADIHIEFLVHIARFMNVRKISTIDGISMSRYILLSNLQKEFVTDKTKKIMLNGAYGSGKTMVLQLRLVDLVNELQTQNKKNDRIFFVTRDKKSLFLQYLKNLAKIMQETITIHAMDFSELSDYFHIPNISLLQFLEEMNRKDGNHAIVDEFDPAKLSRIDATKIKDLITYSDNLKESCILIAMIPLSRTRNIGEKCLLGEQHNEELTGMKQMYLDKTFRCTDDIYKLIQVTIDVIENNPSKFACKVKEDRIMRRKPELYPVIQRTVSISQNTKKESSISKANIGTDRDLKKTSSSAKSKHNDPDTTDELLHTKAVGFPLNTSKSKSGHLESLSVSKMKSNQQEKLSQKESSGPVVGRVIKYNKQDSESEKFDQSADASKSNYFDDELDQRLRKANKSKSYEDDVLETSFKFQKAVSSSVSSNKPILVSAFTGRQYRKEIDFDAVFRVYYALEEIIGIREGKIALICTNMNEYELSVNALRLANQLCQDRYAYLSYLPLLCKEKYDTKLAAKTFESFTNSSNCILLTDINGITGLEYWKVIIPVTPSEEFLSFTLVRSVTRCQSQLALLQMPMYDTTQNAVTAKVVKAWKDQKVVTTKYLILEEMCVCDTVSRALPSTSSVDLNVVSVCPHDVAMRAYENMKKLLSKDKQEHLESSVKDDKDLQELIKKGLKEGLSRRMKMYNLSDQDILLHFNILGLTHSSYNGPLIKGTRLQNIIKKNSKVINCIACMSATTRCLDSSATLLCAALHYITHQDKQKTFTALINTICRTPSNLFHLINLIANITFPGDIFFNLPDLMDYREMAQKNIFAGKKSERAEIENFLLQHEFIVQWYRDHMKSDLDLLSMSTKYGIENGWNHKMILPHLTLASKSPPQYERRLMLNYVLRGKSHIEKEEKYKAFLAQDTDSIYQGKGITATRSQLLSGIYIIEKSKLSAHESWDERKVQRVADLILNLGKNPFYDLRPELDHCEEVLNRHGTLFQPKHIDHITIHHARDREVQVGDPDADASFKVCPEHLPTPLLKFPEIWKALISQLSIDDIFQHLNTMASLGVFEEAAVATTLVGILTHPRALSQVNPFQILKSLLGYAKGTDENKKEKTWKVKESIMDALCRSFMYSLQVRPNEPEYRPKEAFVSVCDLSYKICIECSGPMMMSGFAFNSELSGVRAAVAVSLAIKRCLVNTEICICREKSASQPGDNIDLFEGQGVDRLDSLVHDSDERGSSRQSLEDTEHSGAALTDKDRKNLEEKEAKHQDIYNTMKNIELITPSIKKGRITKIPRVVDEQKSSLAQPMTQAIANRENVDAFILFTTSNPSNLVGKVPYEEFCEYKDQVNNNCKLIICTMETGLHTIADPTDPSVAVFCGADTYLLHEIISFMNFEEQETKQDSKQNKVCFCQVRKNESKD